MDHPDLNWRICQSIIADKHRSAAAPNDTGIAWATRKLLGRAFIALGTRLTPAPTGSGRQSLEPPMPMAPSMK